MSTRIKSYKLPDGSWTDNPDDMKAWTVLTRHVSNIFGEDWHVCGYDPGVWFTKHRNTEHGTYIVIDEMRISVQAMELLNKLYEDKIELENTLKSLREVE